MEKLTTADWVTNEIQNNLIDEECEIYLYVNMLYDYKVVPKWSSFDVEDIEIKELRPRKVYTFKKDMTNEEVEKIVKQFFASDKEIDELNTKYIKNLLNVNEYYKNWVKKNFVVVE